MKILDKELIEQIANKNEKAFNEFYKRYAPLLYKWVYKRIGNAQASNEVTQEFWTNFWLNPHLIKTNDEGSAKNYLLYFFTYRILDYLRSNHKREKSLAYDWEFDNLSETLDYSHILEGIHEKEIYKFIDEILGTLPDLTKEIFICRIEKNYSVTETAKHLKIDQKTVYNRSFTALTIIRSKVKEMLLNDETIKN